MAEEMCTGCGLVSSEPLPFVGVTRDASSGQMTAFPVCYDCWKTPEHRRTKLKMHFFSRAQEEMAVARAGSDNIGDE